MHDRPAGLNPGRGQANTILTRVKPLLVLAFVAALALPAHASAAPRVLAVHFTSDVNPVTADWLNSELDHAQSNGYSAVVIVLDTPGGLEDSMRKIVQKELSLKIPVIVYVSPEGARAASAGVWISQAADLLAMAPETNIGSSTPIQGNGTNIGTDLRRKVINDAAASLRGLAKSHGRNVAWADAAVRKASNLTAEEALAKNVIDVMAPTLPALLNKVNGRVTVPRHFTLDTKDAAITDAHPGVFTRFLSALIDPNIISLLFLAGLAGLGFELFHPGVVIPGAFGAICMVCALFGLAILPVTWGGLALVILGAALLVADLHVPSHGALTLSGLAAMALGFVVLFNKAPAPYHTSETLIVTVTVIIGTLWAFAISKALAIRRAPATVGPEQIVGLEGVARDDGYVLVQGELWRAHSDDRLAPGQRVRVDRLDGLTLDVHRIDA